MTQDKIFTIIQEHIATAIVPTIGNRGMRLSINSLVKPTLEQARHAFTLSDDDIQAKIDGNEAWRVTFSGSLRYPGSHREVYEKQFAWKRAIHNKKEEVLHHFIDSLLQQDMSDSMPPTEHMNARTNLRFSEPIYYFTDRTRQLMTEINFSGAITRYIPLMWGKDEESDIRRCANKLCEHIHSKERCIVNESKYWGDTEGGEILGRYHDVRRISSRRDLRWRIRHRTAWKELAQFIIGHANTEQPDNCNEPIVYGSYTDYPEEYQVRSRGQSTSGASPQTIEELLNLVDVTATQ